MIQKIPWSTVIRYAKGRDFLAVPPCLHGSRIFLCRDSCLSILMITESPFPIKGHSRVVFDFVPVRRFQPARLSLDIPERLLFLSTCWIFT